MLAYYYYMNILKWVLQLLYCTNIKLVTYNIHGLPRIITRDDTYARIQEIGDKLNQIHPDVIHFQEDWTTYGHNILNESLDYITENRLDEHVNSYSIFGSGLFSLSSFEELDVVEAPYEKRYGYDDIWASKGYIVQRLWISELQTSIDFYNTHMDAQDRSGDKKARKSNVEELIKEMNSYSMSRAVIFAGDTNLGSSDTDTETYNRFITGANLTDVAVTMNVTKKIDKILYKSNEVLSVEPVSYDILDNMVELSDHKALQVEFKICKI